MESISTSLSEPHNPDAPRNSRDVVESGRPALADLAAGGCRWSDYAVRLSWPLACSIQTGDDISLRNNDLRAETSPVRRVRLTHRWGIFQQVALCLVLESYLFAANPSLVVQVSNETAPPGGWAQIKISLAQPQLVATAGIGIDLDPTVFGNVVDAAVFSANGDTYGMANLFGRHADAIFGCGANGSTGDNVVFNPASRGIGQVRNLPIAVFTVPVLATAPPGKVIAVTANAKLMSNLFGSLSPYLIDPNGNRYDLSFTPGSITVGGSLSIQNVEPGGGNLPAGAVVRINGTGFSPLTTVQVDGVSVSSTHFSGPQAIDVTLAAPAELTGKRFLLRNPDGAIVEYFSFLRVGTVTGDVNGHSYPLFGVQTLSNPVLFSSPDPRTGAIVVQNPNLTPVDLKIEWFAGNGVPGSQSTATVPAGASWAYYLYDHFPQSGSITSSQPIRAVRFYYDRGAHVYPGSSSSESPTPPFIGSIVNAASQIQGAVSPGEILTVYGIGAGSPNNVGLVVGSSGAIPTNESGVQVLFDGKPASLLYSSSAQTNLIVPYEVANRKSTNIEVVYNGKNSAAWGVAVVPSAPAIFTLGGNGMGPAAVLNQDNSLNGPTNPAPRGSVIQVYATGNGLMSPPGATGSVNQSILQTSALPVNLMVGGVDAPVHFAGAAPGSVSGLLQVNVLVPQNVTSGPALPISLTIGGAQSPDGITIAVQ